MLILAHVEMIVPMHKVQYNKYVLFILEYDTCCRCRPAVKTEILFRRLEVITVEGWMKPEHTISQSSVL